MEHVKLHGGMHVHGRAAVLRATVDEKPRGGVRCWVLAAAIALAVTFVFVGITLWLGLSAATRMATPTAAGDRPLDPFRDLRVAPPPQPPPPSRPPPPAVHLPKKRKGQVEKVHQPEGTGGDATATPSPPTTSTTTTTTTSTTTTTTTTTTTPVPEVQTPPPRETPVGDLPRQPLQSAVPPPVPPPQPRPSPPAPVRRPPPQRWSPPPPAPWSPPLDLRPPPMAPPAPFEDTMVAEAASAPEWRHAADQRVDADPQPLDDAPFRYDGLPPEEAASPVSGFVQDRLRALKDWLVASHAGQDWQDMVSAVNASLLRADPAPALRHLRDMYYNTTLAAGDGDVPLAALVYPTDPAVLTNSSSLVSFGLLAFDLLLLRNVQLLARGEDGAAGQRAEQLLRDPEVRALGALFLPPQEVRQLVHQDQDSALAVRMRGDSGEDDSSGEEQVTLAAVVQEVTSFLASGLRAVLNLGRAYRATLATAGRRVAGRQRDEQQGEGLGGGQDADKSPLDCLWTLYCRSLDKTARLSGPYGFLAKLNGLGLRLLLGTVPVDQALDLLVREATLGWGGLDCARLFPRCSAADAVPVVLDTALGRTPAA